MLIFKRFSPPKLSLFTVFSPNSSGITVYFSNPFVTFRMVLPQYNLVTVQNISDQLYCYLYSVKATSLADVLLAKTFFKVLLNQMYYQRYSGLKTIGVGYEFYSLKESNYLFISAGLSHLAVHRLEYGTQVFKLKKKKRLLVLSSFRYDLLYNECKFIRALRPSNIYSGKGLRLFHELFKLKEGKKKIR